MATITVYETLLAGTYTLMGTGSPPVVPPVVPPVDPGSGPGRGPADPSAISLPWGQGFSWKSIEHGGLRCEGVLCFSLQVPANAPTSAALGRFVVSEFSGPPTPRQIALSYTPMDFEHYIASAAGSLSYGVGYNLQPGTTVYFNVRNFGCSPGQAVNAIVNVAPPL